MSKSHRKPNRRKAEKPREKGVVRRGCPGHGDSARGAAAQERPHHPVPISAVRRYQRYGTALKWFAFVGLLFGVGRIVHVLHTREGMMAPLLLIIISWLLGAMGECIRRYWSVYEGLMDVTERMTDDELLLAISGGDLKLFQQATREFYESCKRGCAPKPQPAVWRPLLRSFWN